MSNHRITPKWAFSNNALINLAYAKFKERGSWEAFGYSFGILVRLSKTIFPKNGSNRYILSQSLWLGKSFLAIFFFQFNALG